MAVSANRLELLQIADAVAREKSIDRMIVVTAMEDAIQKAARSRYGGEGSNEGYSAAASVSAFSPFRWSSVMTRTNLIRSHWPSVVAVGV